MDDTRWALIKWVAAIAILVGVVAYAVPASVDALTQGIRFGADAEADAEQGEGGDDAEGGQPDGEAAGDGDAGSEAEPSAEAELPAGPVEDGEAEAVADLALDAGAAEDFDAGTLTIGGDPDDAVVLQFDLIAGDPECIDTAQLEISVQEAQPASELALFPAGVTDLAALEEGERVEDAVLDPAPSVLAYTDGSPGRLRFDVTGLYQDWALGEPFANGETAEIGEPFTVVIRPSANATVPGRSIDFTSADSSSDEPALTWVGVDGCG